MKKHKTSAREIKDLLKIINRDLKDAEIKGLSADRRFAIAYNVALELATIPSIAKAIGHLVWDIIIPYSRL